MDFKTINSHPGLRQSHMPSPPPAAQRDWRRMGAASQEVAYGFLVASYRRRMGVVAVREMARHRYRQAYYVGLTRAQIAQHGAAARRDQRQAVRVHEARAERSVEDAQAQYVPAHFRAA